MICKNQQKELNDRISTRCFRALSPYPHPETAPELSYTSTYYAIMRHRVFSKYIMPICLFFLLFEMTWRCFCKAIGVATVISPPLRPRTLLHSAPFRRATERCHLTFHDKGGAESEDSELKIQGSDKSDHRLYLSKGGSIHPNFRFSRVSVALPIVAYLVPVFAFSAVDRQDTPFFDFLCGVQSRRSARSSHTHIASYS